jgi:hypothetical protein
LEDRGGRVWMLVWTREMCTHIIWHGWDLSRGYFGAYLEKILLLDGAMTNDQAGSTHQEQLIYLIGASRFAHQGKGRTPFLVPFGFDTGTDYCRNPQPTSHVYSLSYLLYPVPFSTSPIIQTHSRVASLRAAFLPASSRQRATQNRESERVSRRGSGQRDQTPHQRRTGPDHTKRSASRYYYNPDPQHKSIATGSQRLATATILLPFESRESARQIVSHLSREKSASPLTHLHPQRKRPRQGQRERHIQGTPGTTDRTSRRRVPLPSQIQPPTSLRFQPQPRYPKEYLDSSSDQGSLPPCLPALTTTHRPSPPDSKDGRFPLQLLTFFNGHRPAQVTDHFPSTFLAEGPIALKALRTRQNTRRSSTDREPRFPLPSGIPNHIMFTRFESASMAVLVATFLVFVQRSSALTAAYCSTQNTASTSKSTFDDPNVR